jgi:alpha-1,3/alpha-1,6-mannosyltransferase
MGVPDRQAAGPWSIWFLRPRLGIGGAERLVVDTASELQRRGHRVKFFIADRSEQKQFPPIAERQIDVEVHGAAIPTHVAQRLRLPLAMAKGAYATWAMSRADEQPDLVFCDVVPQLVPFVQRLLRTKVLYYCHFPDLLLTPEGKRAAAWYRDYRKPLDRLEASGLAAADRIAVNSRFTAAVVGKTFPGISPSRLVVLHPGVEVDGSPRNGTHVARGGDGPITLLSISRFDPKKNLPLAIEALARLRPLLPAALFDRVELVLAGHYDERLDEQRLVVEDLNTRARAHNVERHVRLVFSLPESEREALLGRCRCVLYTPEAEHFGYVPLEAMASSRPVVAVNVGGPTETVLHDETGMLCPPDPDAFAGALARLIQDEALAHRMGEAGRVHVAKEFSLQVFGERLEALIGQMVGR